ncbi:response regulator transcription factor [Metabacillus bambusae]|uniref:Response regulator n=1 Tax=Metabacillus bambusae TaxID=2795218 RepID=A0ABS3N0X1_9BACI|nr:response regulator [Metabacillus bambusae]MBO1511843.1 response regulator [Metabacillus bambusae]
MERNDTLRILIVEDEIAVRRSLKGKIRRYDEGSFEIEEAKNAEEAYEMIKKVVPHIIFLDMKMPGMGGMAFLEILKAEFLRIKVIVLSGYSDFKYVQKALQCGAMDYLLKPVIKDELYKAMHDVTNKIEQETKKIKSEVKNHQLLKRSTALLKDNLMNDLLYSNQQKSTDILKKLAMLGIEFNCDRYLIVTMYILNEDEMKSYFSDDLSMLFFGLENVMIDSLEFLLPIVSFRSKVNENEWITIIGFNECEPLREEVEKGCYKIIQNTGIYHKLNLQIINSELFIDLKNLYSNYRKTASVYQSEKQRNAVLFVEDIYQKESTALLGPVWSTEEEKRLTDLLQESDIKKVTEFVQDCFSRLHSLEGESPVSSIALVTAIFDVLEKHCHKINKLYTQGSQASMPTLSEFLLKHDSNLRLGLISILSKFCSELDNGMTKKESKKIVKEIQEYLHVHYYDSDISLDGLAHQHYINRSYLSEIFKTEVGVPFKKYLVQVRIEKAMELLSEQPMKVSDVAYLVGFNDPDYFGTVFKKQTGMTVREYSDKFSG